MGLKKYFDKVKLNLEKNEKSKRWIPFVESFETFFFVQGEVTKPKGCHIRDAIDMKRTMIVVVAALIPALLFGMWNTGYQHFISIGKPASFGETFWFGFSRVLPVIIVSYVAGLGTEFIFVYIKKKEIEEGFFVSGMLIPLILPVDIPLWMVAVATIFAVVIGKEAFGGTGMNFVNPALTARVFLFFAYPSKMSGDLVWISGLENGQGIIDGFSGATPLANAALGNIEKLPSVFDMFIGTTPGSIGETSTLAILIGAVILLYTGIASWKIMLSTVAGALAIGGLFYLFAVNPYMEIPVWHHLVMGGFAFGTVFMATDPVTAAQTERGKWIYGFLIGALAIIIRVANPAFPEGMMLAILLMNVFAPLIDHYVVKANIERRLKRVTIK